MPHKRKWGDWSEHYSAKKKKNYYYNGVTKKSTFETPEGFEANAVQQGYSKTKGTVFWYNRSTGQYTYTVPDGWTESATNAASCAASSSRPAAASRAASSSRPAGLDERHLMMSGFPRDTTKAAVRELFKKYGTIHNLQLVQDPHDSSKTRGYGFVVFTELKDAEYLVEQQDVLPLTIGDKRVKVSQVVAHLQTKSGLGGKVIDGWGKSVKPCSGQWGDIQERAHQPAGLRGHHRR